MKEFFLIVVTFFCIQIGVCQKDSIIIVTEFDTSKVANIEELNMTVKLYNNSKKPIEISKKPKFSVEEDIFGDVRIELNRLGDSCFQKIVTDINYSYFEERGAAGLQMVLPGGSVNYKYDLRKIYSLRKNKYRLRVYFLCHVQTQAARIYARSQWVYFDIP